MSVPEIVLSSGHKIPSIGLGMFLTKDPNEVKTSLQGAIDAGYRHIDTAFTYFNEEYIGSFLQNLFQQKKIKREDLFIVSKLPPNGLRPDAVPYFFQKSLSALKLDYLDLYLIHFPVAAKRTENDNAIFPTKNGVFDGDTVDLVDTWKAMEKLVKDGLVRSIGLSNFNSQQIQRVYDTATIKPCILQNCPLCDSKFQRKNHFFRHMRWHESHAASSSTSSMEISEDEALPEVRTVECQPQAMLDEVHPEKATVKERSELTETSTHVECHAYLPQFELQEFCKKLNIQMTAYAPLGSPGTSGGETRLLDEEKLKPICLKYGKSPAQVLLRYLVQRNIIVIPKSSNPKRLVENFQIFDFCLTDEEMHTLKSLARNKRYFTFETYPGMTDQSEYPFKIPY